jgi:hypothetical protein
LLPECTVGHQADRVIHWRFSGLTTKEELEK